jgi:ribA/ribD-fused uncharacterized protein
MSEEITLEGIMKQLLTMNDSIKEIKVSIETCNSGIATCNENHRLLSTDIVPRIELMEQNIKAIKSDVVELKERNIKLEAYVRRDNLLFGGLAESDNEDCEEIIRSHINSELGLQCDHMKFVRVHRLGRKLPGKARPIIVRFHFFGDRKEVWSKRSELQGSDFWLAEDFPNEIQDRRRILKPILKHAVKLQGSTNGIYLIADRLVIANKTYTVNNLHSLPPELSPARISTREIGDKFTVFFNENSPLSNFHPATFTQDGTVYCHVEQYFAAQKAQITKNRDIHSEIMKESSPLGCKRLAKQLPNTIEWKRSQEEVMTTGCTAKFVQNPNLLNFLLKTTGKSIVEARKDDKFWGAGLGPDDPQLLTDKWPGKNKLGKILMAIRANHSSD